MGVKCKFLLLVVAVCGVFGGLHAATFLSQYGEIQNVQTYSSNPFWNPNSPYNQRMPQPVYVDGPDLNASECQAAVYALVQSYCSMNNGCADKSLSDVRPAVMLQLSRMPGHNYATACSGYLDTAFKSYRDSENVTVSGFPTPFPDASPGGAAENGTGDIQIFKAPVVPQWKQDMRDRAQELKDLQSQNGANDVRLAHADFPMTINDLSFVDRQLNAAAGYAPYKDASAYKTIEVESMDDYLERLKKTNYAAWCERTGASECQRAQNTAKRHIKIALQMADS